MRKVDKAQVVESKLPPWLGLTLDSPVPGGLYKAINVNVTERGEFLERRNPTRVVDTDGETALASRGYKHIHELPKGNGDKYLLVDLDYWNEEDEENQTKIMGANNTTSSENVSISGWTSVKDGLTTGVSITPDYANAMDRAYRVDGANNNLVIKDLDTAQNCGISMHSNTVSLAGTTGGSMGPTTDPEDGSGSGGGLYYVYYTYAKKDDGVGTSYTVESYPTNEASVSLSSNQNAISVNVSLSNDPDVTDIYAYRNLYGSSSAFFRCASMANGSGPLVLTMSDVSIAGHTTMDYNEPPPKCKFIEYAGEKLWFGNCVSITNGSSMLKWSGNNSPEEVPITNYHQFDALDGDEITGIGRLANSIVVFKHYKSWLLELYAPYPKHQLSKTIGCVDARSITNTGRTNQLIWMSHSGVMAFDGANFSNLTEGRLTQKFKDYINDSCEFHGRYDATNERYHLIVLKRSADQSEITTHVHYVWHSVADAWTEWQFKDSSGDRIYDVVLGSSLDVNWKEVILTATITDLDGTTVTLTQQEVEAGAYTIPDDVITEYVSEIYTFDDYGANAMIADGNDNLYFSTAISYEPAATHCQDSSGIKKLVPSSQTVTTLSVTGGSLKAINSDKTNLFGVYNEESSYDLGYNTGFKRKLQKTAISTGSTTTLSILTMRYGTHHEDQNRDDQPMFEKNSLGAAVIGDDVYYVTLEYGLDQWAPDTDYAVGDVVQPPDTSIYFYGHKYVCVQAGKSGTKPIFPGRQGADAGSGTGVSWIYQETSSPDNVVPSVGRLLYDGARCTRAVGGADDYYPCIKHGLSNGDQIVPFSTGTSRANFTDGVPMFVRKHTSFPEDQVHFYNTYADAMADTNRIGLISYGDEGINEATFLQPYENGTQALIWQIQVYEDADITIKLKKKLGDESGTVSTIYTFGAGDCINGRSLQAGTSNLFVLMYNASDDNDCGNYGVGVITTSGDFVFIRYQDFLSDFLRCNLAVRADNEIYFSDIGTMSPGNEAQTGTAGNLMRAKFENYWKLDALNIDMRGSLETFGVALPDVPRFHCLIYNSAVDMLLSTEYRDHCISLHPLSDKLWGRSYVFDYTQGDVDGFPIFVTGDRDDADTGWWRPTSLAIVNGDYKEIFFGTAGGEAESWGRTLIGKLKFNPVFWDFYLETIYHLYEETQTMSLEGVEVEIESVFYDMESPTVAKKFRRAYVEIDNVAPMSGYIHFEPGYNMRRRLHTHGESATPDHSVSGGAFGSAGTLDWETTPANFDDTIGNWMKHRIDLGLLGNSVRFMLKLGDVDSSLNGRIRIKAPILLHKNKGVR